MKSSTLTAIVSAWLILGCSSSGSNRDSSPTDTTSSRRAQGLDASYSPTSTMNRQTAANTATPQDSVTGSVSGAPLTGDVTQDTSATKKTPLNTSPSVENGLPADGGAVVQKKSAPLNRKTKAAATATPLPQ